MKKKLPAIVTAGGRKTWGFSPVTRVKQSKKNYNRQKNKVMVGE